MKFYEGDSVTVKFKGVVTSVDSDGEVFVETPDGHGQRFYPNGVKAKVKHPDKPQAGALYQDSDGEVLLCVGNGEYYGLGGDVRHLSDLNMSRWCMVELPYPDATIY